MLLILGSDWSNRHAPYRGLRCLQATLTHPPAHRLLQLPCQPLHPPTDHLRAALLTVTHQAQLGEAQAQATLRLPPRLLLLPTDLPQAQALLVTLDCLQALAGLALASERQSN